MQRKWQRHRGSGGRQASGLPPDGSARARPLILSYFTKAVKKHQVFNECEAKYNNDKFADLIAYLVRLRVRAGLGRASTASNAREIERFIVRD